MGDTKALCPGAPQGPHVSLPHSLGWLAAVTAVPHWSSPVPVCPGTCSVVESEEVTLLLKGAQEGGDARILIFTLKLEFY